VTCGAFAVMRLGAPHEGHAVLVARMLASCPPDDDVLVLVGSSDKTGRADVPLPWEERGALLGALLRALGHDAERVRFWPLPEIPLDGFTPQWFEHILGACRAATGTEPRRYFFGDDYDVRCFDLLLAMRPGTELHRVARTIEKSGRELQRAIRARDPALTARYSLELACYGETVLERIRRS
jgi:nicotinamide mononucleotide adenylyltransferase